MWFVVTIRNPKRTSNISVGAICPQYSHATCKFLEKIALKVY